MNEDVQIVDFNEEEEEHAIAFRDLNLEWITKYFEPEPSDHKVLNAPLNCIIRKGGAILMAKYNNEIVGTCALINSGNYIYELSKMAVAPKAQGLKIGYLLGKAIVDKAKVLNAKSVVLYSNTGLTPAISLYRKLGFIEVPLASSEYKRSDIKMELCLC